ncbi:Kef-type potassium/proton antiporter accessory protein, CPA2 family [Ferrimonas balearica DSM 9799]|uniref:Kef-type potassium/proton antiporter accessory protein, CPA2 family n=1 Tax=Ferrimonas balearica (strain DSM 9799 / CCM 4581 / KCTC 23876 / PAT) TaxID=550540 RepID=E1SRE5_FERBD|nr:NAD(P)H-dependent oxidoreductase [Ferrimonas balearica]ADN75896.1 Kef-type potassium/proton antiporter accessory protein, CPA2 family [Ferrimonas balearica DSM 9799]
METPAPRNILVLFAHPAQQHSEITVRLARAVKDLPNVTLVDLYAEYPTLEINIAREQERLLQHDVIVFLHPLYWYSTPAILKEWMDLVLEYNFAYGHKGLALKGKYLFASVSAGGQEHAYGAEGYNRYSLRELLRPLEMTANLCHMNYLPPFAIYGARTAVEEKRLAPHRERFVELLTRLSEDRIDLSDAATAPSLNAILEAQS